MRKAPLKLLFASAAFGLIQGCTSMPQRGDCMDQDSIRLPFLFGVSTTTYDKGCAVDTTAKAMIGTNDPATQAVGINILRKRHGEIDDATKASIGAKKRPLDCKVTSVKIAEDGSRILTVGNCKSPVASNATSQGAPHRAP